MAGRVHLAILILTACVNGCWCVSWNKLKFKALNTVGWELSTVTGVPSLEFVDNFMIPCRHDPKQIMVGNGNGFSPNSGEGCIQIYYMRNMSKPVKEIAGKCSRQNSGSFNFNDGIGLAARIKWPDHGYITEDGQWLLFVDNKSCARKMKMTTKQVTTVIGQCSSGTLDLDQHGQARLVIGMVYLDEKNFWVFFVESGLYIYSWNGDSKRQVAERNQMSAFHGSSMEAGLITKGTRTSYNFEVYQKVQYGVTRYNFDRISLTHHSFAVNDLRPSKLFSLTPNADPDAKYKFHFLHRPLYMTASNGHVAQHPYHRGLLMVTDWAESRVFVFNINDGMARLYCKHGNTVVHGESCILPSVKSTMWVGEGALSAIVVDRSESRTYELVFNYDSNYDKRCEACWNAPGESRCHSLRRGVTCLCTVGYAGHNCVNAVCPPNKCNGHGQCTFDDTNRPKCTCNNGWRGETCKYQKALLLEYVSITELQYGQPSTLTARVARVGEGFLLNKLKNPSVLIVGHRHWERNNEGAIGYYRLGRMTNFVSLAGNLSRTGGPSKYDDGTAANAHMVEPMFGYQEKNGKWLHFVDSNSCARRLRLFNTLKVVTWCGIGRCGNGTLNLNHYGSQTRVTGMTMIEFGTQAFVFSVPFGIYIYNWSGLKKRRVVGGWASFYKKHMDISGSLTGRYQYNDSRPVFFQNTPYGITKYDFRWGAVKATNKKLPLVSRIASLKPYSTLLFEKGDHLATHNFDYNQPNTFGGAGGIIDINPVYSNILMVADHGQGSVVIYNITSGTSLSVCRNFTGPNPSIIQTNNAATCKWVELKSAMWLTATTALVSDYSIHGRVYRVIFRIGVNACESNPCGHGICSDLESGFYCLCDDNWSGSTCSVSTPRVGAVFPALGSFDAASHLMSIGTPRSETFSIMMFTASLTSCTVF